jgi:hypothetical protein
VLGPCTICGEKSLEMSRPCSPRRLAARKPVSPVPAASSRVHVTAPGRVMTRVWVDGRERAPVDVSGAETLVVPLGEERWHSVVLDVPRLFRGNPPRGLRLERLLVRPET